MCVTVMSHNNIENNRYKKVMQSILQQDYGNYHIVFIDDNSDDGNLESTMEFMQDKGAKIQYIRNKKNKFATYNIVHAAFSFCKMDEIQVLIDGDDELIGRQAFFYLNAEFHKSSQPWLVYESYFSSIYTYGESKDVRYRLNPSLLGKRKSGHYVGPTRSWYVSLIRSIPLKYH